MNTQPFSFEEALELNPTGMFQWRLFVICGLAFMTDSLGVNLLSFLTTCAAAKWNLSDASQALLTSIVFVGIILGSMFWGRYAEAYGRKKTLLYSCLMVTLGGFASAVAPAYIFLVLSRAIAGFGIGGASIPFDLLAEFLPASSRSVFLVYMGVFWTFGSMFVAGMAWMILPVLGWRFLAFVTTVPVLLTTAIAYIHLPESPRWLLSKDREEDAVRIIRDAALVNGIVLQDFKISASGGDAGDGGKEGGNYIDLVSSRLARRITLPLWAIWASFGFSYYGVILFVSRIYSNQDAVSRHGAAVCEFNYAAIFYNAAAEIVSVVISAALIEPLGRRWSQSAFYAAGGVAVMCMGFKQTPGMLLFFSIMARMCVNSGLVATWVVTPELFNTQTRTMGHSSCTAVSRVGSFFASFLVVSTLPYSTVGIVLGLFNISAAVASLLLPETAGKTLDEVNASTLHKMGNARAYALLDSASGGMSTHSASEADLSHSLPGSPVAPPYLGAVEMGLSVSRAHNSSGGSGSGGSGSGGSGGGATVSVLHQKPHHRTPVLSAER